MILNQNLQTGYDYDRLVDSAVVVAKICGVNISEKDRNNWEILLECMVRIDDLFDDEGDADIRSEMVMSLMEYFSTEEGTPFSFCTLDSIEKLKSFLVEKGKLQKFSRILGNSLVIFEQKRNVTDVKKMFILRWQEGICCGKMIQLMLEDTKSSDMTALMRFVAFGNVAEHLTDMVKDWENGETKIIPSFQSKVRYLIMTLLTIRKVKRKWSVFKHFWDLLPRGKMYESSVLAITLAILLNSCAPLENTAIQAPSEDVVYPDIATMHYRAVKQFLQRRDDPPPLDQNYDDAWGRLCDALEDSRSTEYVDDEGNVVNFEQLEARDK